MRRTLLTLALIVLVGAGTALFAAHFNPYGSSVDGDEIRYVDNTSYNDALSWAITEWNDLNPIEILPDSAFTIADVEVFDINDGNISWAGAWSPRTGSDWIRINTYHVGVATTFEKRGVMAHEFGHALGLGDHTSGDGAGSNILMYETCCQVNTPQAHDEDDYDDLWN